MNMDQLRGMFYTAKAKGTEYAGIAAEKTKDAARLARLKMSLISEKEALKRTYTEIGRQYYQQHRGTANGILAELCDEIDANDLRIANLEAEIDNAKRDLGMPVNESDVEVEITEE